MEAWELVTDPLNPSFELQSRFVIFRVYQLLNFDFRIAMNLLFAVKLCVSPSDSFRFHHDIMTLRFSLLNYCKFNSVKLWILKRICEIVSQHCLNAFENRNWKPKSFSKSAFYHSTKSSIYCAAFYHSTALHSGEICIGLHHHQQLFHHFSRDTLQHCHASALLATMPHCSVLQNCQTATLQRCHTAMSCCQMFRSNLPRGTFFAFSLICLAPDSS